MKTYFFRLKGSNVWLRTEIDKEIDWNRWITCEEAIELQPDGTGKYKRCAEMPMKEDWFYKIPDNMLMIALKAETVHLAI